MSRVSVMKPEEPDMSIDEDLGMDTYEDMSPNGYNSYYGGEPKTEYRIFEKKRYFGFWGETVAGTKMQVGKPYYKERGTKLWYTFAEMAAEKLENNSAHVKIRVES